MNLSYYFRFWLACLFILGISVSNYATHLRAGEIIVERVNCNSLTFRITITVFTNTINTNVLFGGEDDFLDFGDGSDPDGDGRPGIKVPETKNTLRPDLGEGIATASYTILHTYSGFQEYTISYSEPNRNEGVVNMDGSVNTRFYIETKIIVDPYLGCNNTPKLLVPPIDRACVGVAWFHNPGAYDPDGDSLSYQLVIPYRDENTTVINYKDPSDPKFYTDYQHGSESGTKPSFSINPTDGTITWDAPGMAGEYNIAFTINKWRKKDGEWRSMGFVRRDMQIIVEDCKNDRPDLIVPEDVCVEAGSVLSATIFGIDPNNDPVKIEAFSEIFNFAPAQSPATYTPNDGKPVKSNPRAELHFEWKTECFHVKEQPYQVVFKITDFSPTGSKLVTFKTWFIKVVGPEPTWVSASLDLATRSTNLLWNSYVCQNAQTIQVWRRVDSFAFTPDSCQTGMPDFLGYEQIATLPVKDANGVPTTTYKDTNNGKGLASGAKYCYRLVAIFPPPRGGESYVSDEICVGPILADKPIITNVSILKTSPTAGQIFVKWLAPFEADPAQFPPPYKYDVYRAEGFAGNANLTKVSSATPGLTFTDNSGPNTQDKIYNYRIIAFDANNNPLDTSTTASTVRLEAKSQLKKIELSWSAFVPWSNLRQFVPNKHLIFRGPEGATESQLELIDSVDVTAGGFTYLDEGKFKGQALEANKLYCYRVMTRGGYGNPQIAEPLVNFSQIICAQPGDEEAPCQPATPLPEKPVDCQAYSSDIQTCNNNVFSNTIRWARPDDEACRNDVAFYRIYAASSSNGNFDFLADVRDTVYIDLNLPSFARCYKIKAVDRSNNESEFSEAVCFDNCPYYELPNVFSPNGDKCNDVFSAYSDRDITGENGEGISACTTPEINKAKCARFVEKVVFKVYNRWGKEVYSYASGGERTIYIDWDGRASDRTELATGIYYYAADVTFDMVDSANKHKIIKGWVHLIR